jgi:hypothetical protein
VAKKKSGYPKIIIKERAWLSDKKKEDDSFISSSIVLSRWDSGHNGIQFDLDLTLVLSDGNQKIVVANYGDEVEIREIESKVRKMINYLENFLAAIEDGESCLHHARRAAQTEAEKKKAQEEFEKGSGV